MNYSLFAAYSDASFQTKVTSVRKAAATEGEGGDDPDRARWVINDDTDNVFDAVIVAIGTCGDPNWITLPGMPDHEENKPQPQDTESAATVTSETPSQDAPTPGTPPHNNKDFGGIILHSSQLDSPEFDLKGGERVVVIGSGASGVEAVETVLQKFGSVRDSQDGKEEKKGVEVFLIARNDKWIIPRNTVIDTAIAGQPFGREMPLRYGFTRFLHARVRLIKLLQAFYGRVSSGIGNMMVLKSSFLPILEYTKGHLYASSTCDFPGLTQIN